MTDERPGWGDQHTRTASWHDPVPALSLLASMSGLDYLRGIRDGVVPPPPWAMSVGMGIASVEPGVVTFTLEPQEHHFNPLGVVHGGVLCTLLDTVAGCAVHSTLESGWGYTSIDLNVSYLRAVGLGSGLLTFTGRVVKGGRRVAFASAEGTDAAGNLVATATSSLLVMAP